jgi:lysine decarboxylase
LADHPEAVAVFCVEPSYLGALSDLPRVIDLAHQRNLPVLVDQAWGAHLGFAPNYPPHALALGADAMVTSAHKTLPAFSQASIVLARTERLDADRLERAFEAGHTTSPSGAILASIDASRALLASDRGHGLLLRLAESVADLRSALRPSGILIPDPADFPTGRMDPAKLVLCMAPSGRSGLELEAHLLASGLPVEMADRDTVVPLVSLLDDTDSLGQLRDAVLDAMARLHGTPRPITVAGQWAHTAPQVMTPREAFFARHETVPIAAALGRVSAEVIAPYPPGIPIAVPGEQVTEETIAALRTSLHAGTRIAYAADPQLRTMQVVQQTPNA